MKMLYFFVLCFLVLTLAPSSITPASAHAMGGHAGPGVTSLDIYSEGPHLHLLIARRNSTDAPAELLYCRSDDGGATWSKPVRVGENQPAVYDRRGMDAQIAASGDRLLAVWTTRVESNRYDRGPLATAISSDGGKTWRPGPNPADDGLASDHGLMDIAADETGAFHLAWLDSRGGQKGLEYAHSEDGGASWSKNRMLVATTCECCWNTIQTTPGGKVLVLYRQHNPRDMGIIGSSDGGKTWGEPVTVGAFDWKINACPHAGGGLAIVPGTEGRICHAVVWTGKEKNHGAYLFSSSDGGKTWDRSQRLGNTTSWHPDIAAKTNGELAAVWDAYTSGGQAIFTAHCQDGGKSWSAPLRLNPPSTDANYPRIVSTPTGFCVFWTQQTKDQGMVWKSQKF